LLKDEVIAYILIGLLESWSTISTIIENQPLEAHALDSVINTLNTHEHKLATQALNPTVQSNAHLARHQQRKNTRQQGNRPSKRSRSQDNDKDQDDDDEC